MKNKNMKQLTKKVLETALTLRIVKDELEFNNLLDYGRWTIRRTIKEALKKWDNISATQVWRLYWGIIENFDRINRKEKEISIFGAMLELEELSGLTLNIESVKFQLLTSNMPLVLLLTSEKVEEGLRKVNLKLDDMKIFNVDEEVISTHIKLKPKWIDVAGIINAVLNKEMTKEEVRKNIDNLIPEVLELVDKDKEKELLDMLADLQKEGKA